MAYATGPIQYCEDAGFGWLLPVLFHASRVGQVSREEEPGSWQLRIKQ